MSRHHKASSRKWRKLRSQILAASDVCWICGGPGADSIDHVLPVSLYPELEMELGNLRPAHLRCNIAKGNRPIQTKRYEPKSRNW
jgi:5-methylcytosine-specific restriction endonuclease McrA